ncbi:YeeE/YedE thiosulfate transporter family protein [Shigella flexneri]
MASMLKSGVILKLSISKDRLNPHDGMVVLGMFGGCFAAALWANDVKLACRAAVSALCRPLLAALSPVGARLAIGCNLAAFFTGIPQFSLVPGSLPSPLPLVHGLARALPAAHLRSSVKCRELLPPSR